MYYEECKKSYLNEIQERIQELRKLKNEMPEYKRAVSHEIAFTSSLLVFHSKKPRIMR